MNFSTAQTYHLPKKNFEVQFEKPKINYSMQILTSVTLGSVDGSRSVDDIGSAIDDLTVELLTSVTLGSVDGSRSVDDIGSAVDDLTVELVLSKKRTLRLLTSLGHREMAGTVGVSFRFIVFFLSYNYYKKFTLILSYLFNE